MKSTVFLIFVAIIVNTVSCMLLYKDKETVAAFDGGVKSKFLKIYSICCIVVNLAIAIILSFVFTEDGTLFLSKQICVLAIMWAIFLTDLKTRRIPNKFILFGLIFRFVILFLELLFKKDTNPLASLFSEFVVAVALLLASILCALCIKNSIGFGDMKLFVVMAFLLGSLGVWSAIFVSLLMIFLVAVFLLLTKKKTRKDSVPFGPAIAVGTYISILLSGM